MDEHGEDLVGDVAFQAPDDVSVSQSFGPAVEEVRHGARLAGAHAPQHDPVQAWLA
ncbi:hypothetical protein [Kocuria sp. WN036]|uniref:hypothetical protein n=1 Tax=Kocuria sp. WN036 TaxID=2032628 RepID=UPI0020D16A48|nr:hypothetical protein [Kocuria sp. WN036]